MQRIKKIKQGHVYIEVNYDEITLKLNGMGICDSCSPLKEIKHGFLVLVLNAVYCEECFDEWKERAEYFIEDLPYETKKTEIYLKQLNG